MKKIVKIILVLFIMCGIMLTKGICMAISSNVSLEMEKTEVHYNEDFIVNVVISNVNAERGIIAISADLEYDPNSITFIGMDAQNGWEKVEYNEQNHKLIADRGNYQTENETAIKMVFKVNLNGTGNTEILLKNIMISNGIEENSVMNAAKLISIVSSEDQNQNLGDDQNQSPFPTPDDTIWNQGGVNGSESSGNGESSKPKNKPSTSNAVYPSASPTNNANSNEINNNNVVEDTNKNQEENKKVEISEYTTSINTAKQSAKNTKKTKGNPLLFIICVLAIVGVTIMVKKKVIDKNQK